SVSSTTSKKRSLSSASQTFARCCSVIVFLDLFHHTFQALRSFFDRDVGGVRSASSSQSCSTFGWKLVQSASVQRYSNGLTFRRPAPSCPWRNASAFSRSTNSFTGVPPGILVHSPAPRPPSAQSHCSWAQFVSWTRK